MSTRPVGTAASSRRYLPSPVNVSRPISHSTGTKSSVSTGSVSSGAPLDSRWCVRPDVSTRPVGVAASSRRYLPSPVNVSRPISRSTGTKSSVSTGSVSSGAPLDSRW